MTFFIVKESHWQKFDILHTETALESALEWARAWAKKNPGNVCYVLQRQRVVASDALREET